MKQKRKLMLNDCPTPIAPENPAYPGFSDQSDEKYPKHQLSSFNQI